MKKTIYIPAFTVLFLVTSCERYPWHKIECDTDKECEEMLVGYWQEKRPLKSKQVIWLFKENKMTARYTITTGGRTDLTETEIAEVDSFANTYPFTNSYQIDNNNIIINDTATTYTENFTILQLTASKLKFIWDQHDTKEKFRKIE